METTLLINGGIAVVVIAAITRLIKVLRNGVTENLQKMVDSLQKIAVSEALQEKQMQFLNDKMDMVLKNQTVETGL
jgi:hypothetical protein